MKRLDSVALAAVLLFVFVLEVLLALESLACTGEISGVVVIIRGKHARLEGIGSALLRARERRVLKLNLVVFAVLDVEKVLISLNRAPLA